MAVDATWEREVLRDGALLDRLEAGWQALADALDAGPTQGAEWTLAAARALPPGEAALALLLRRGDELGAACALTRGPARVVGAVPAHRLRLLQATFGARRVDALVRPGLEVALAEAVTALLVDDDARAWDVAELGPLPEDAALAEPLALRLRERGRAAVVEEAPAALLADLGDGYDAYRAALGARGEPAHLRAGDAGCALVRLEDPRAAVEVVARTLRRERAARGLYSPLDDAHVDAFVTELARRAAARGRLLAVGLVRGEEVRAAALAVIAGGAATLVAHATAPDARAERATEALLAETLRLAAEAGARVVDLGCEDEADRATVAMASTRRREVRLHAFNSTPAGVVARSTSALRRSAEAVAEASPRAARALARLGERAVGYSSLHLYRGELYVRDIAPPAGARLRLVTLDELEALPDRRAFYERLSLADEVAHEHWRRGDLAVLAEVDGRPSGILWCARTAVYVPELGRPVHPGAGECYIHDVYVHPDVRGRAVAPAMLDFLARELRGRDVYRAWALIERTNSASTRAFEKAAYASVADVLYARVGLAARLVVRPPDPEARKLLGLD